VAASRLKTPGALYGLNPTYKSYMECRVGSEVN
jgi:hypothetical protein